MANTRALALLLFAACFTFACGRSEPAEEPPAETAQPATPPAETGQPATQPVAPPPQQETPPAPPAAEPETSTPSAARPGGKTTRTKPPAGETHAPSKTAPGEQPATPPPEAGEQRPTEPPKQTPPPPQTERQPTVPPAPAFQGGTKTQAAPKDVIMLRAPLGAVRFEHKLHAGVRKIPCDTCHHPSRPQEPATAPQQACRDCHTSTAKPPMKTKLQAAFHSPTATSGLCIDCHKKTAAGKSPVKCPECHKKGATEAIPRGGRQVGTQPAGSRMG